MLVSSDLGRAIETAKLVKNEVNQDLTIELSRHFREVFVGDLEGKTTEELNSTYKEMYDEYLSFEQGLKVESNFDLGESFESKTLRTEKGLVDAIQKANELNLQSIIICSHSTILAHLFCRHMSYNPKKELDSASITHFIANFNEKEKVSLKDTVFKNIV